MLISKEATIRESKNMTAEKYEQMVEAEKD